MPDIRKNVDCNYCGAHFHIKFSDEMTLPQFCAFCSEPLLTADAEDEDDDGDLDYTDLERDDTLRR